MRLVREVGGVIAILVVTLVTSVCFGLWDPSGLIPGRAGAMAASPPSTAEGGAVDSNEASTRGRDLFLSSCATCHGADGRGTGHGPSLASAGPADWHFYLATGRMPLEDPGTPLVRREPAFDASDIAALVEYGRTLGSGPEQPQLVTGIEARDGWSLYTNDCAACHGPTGSGAAIGPDAIAPSLRGLDPQVIAEAPLVGPGPMPQFGFDDRQLSSIAAYVEELGSESQGGADLGGFGPVAEGLMALAVALVMLLLTVRWIGTGGPGEQSGKGPGRADGT